MTSTGRAVRATWLEALFEGEVAAAELKGLGDPAELLPEELVGQGRWVAKRVSQFAAGRQCARLAMGQLGVPSQPLIARPDRRPEWPAGVVGSISHCEGFACAVVARQSSLKSVGVDVEIAGAVEENLWPRVLTEEERAWIDPYPPADRRTWATIFFSAKESFYKCQHPVTGHWLEFHGARISVLSAPGETAQIDLRIESQQAQLMGRGTVRDGIVYTAVTWRR
jgi:4'-phosphopantetheinyl transferase EntD